MKDAVLVTGGAGFIGAHLCSALLERGDRVVCVDNLSSGHRDNIRHLMSHECFEFIEADVCDFRYDGDVGQVFNLACPASPIFYQSDPVQTIKTNFLGMLGALETATRCGARILQASTSEIYGDPLVHPQREDYRGNVSTTGIRACYDEGKRAAEALCFDFMRQHGTDIAIARIFNTYGPGMRPDDGRVVSNFILQALRGHDIEVYGDGLQTRSFCYVDDTVRCLLALMDAEGFAGPVNIGNPVEITVLELAQRIVAMTGSKSRIVHRELPQDDPLKRKPDIALAGERLGWKPVVALEDGLARTIEYFEGFLGRG